MPILAWTQSSHVFVIVKLINVTKKSTRYLHYSNILGLLKKVKEIY